MKFATWRMLGALELQKLLNARFTPALPSFTVQSDAKRVLHPPRKIERKGIGRRQPKLFPQHFACAARSLTNIIGTDMAA